MRPSCCLAKASRWRKIIDFDALIEEGMITLEDLKLIEFAETAEDGWASLVRRAACIFPASIIPIEGG